MNILVRISILALLSSFCSTAIAGQLPTPGPIEQTLAFEMLQAENDYRTHMPDGEFAVLKKAIADATDAALAINPKPRTQQDALKVLEAIQKSLERQNFFQPTFKPDWPNTMGEALTPRNPQKDAGKTLGWPDYSVDTAKPIYLVDCDMGAMLFISVGQRLGWDIRLVEVRSHNYMHWHLPSGTIVNWDWTNYGSLPDSSYGSDPRYGDWLVGKRSGISQNIDFARSYYLALIGYKPKNSEVLKSGTELRPLLERALSLDPQNDWAQNALAWNYAIDSNLPNSYYKAALAYALAAWSANPEDAGTADTVACSFFALGQREMALKTESYALSLIARDDSPDTTTGLNSDMKKMTAGSFCSDSAD